ncbi:polymorphic toxin MafB class 3, partial [Neisseria meningitidis]
VKNRVYAVQTFDATAVGPILPITHERTGFEGVIGYETHFSGHGHEVHSPFDNHDSRSTSDFSGGVDGGFTVYQLHRTGSEIHPEDGYDGPQGSDYPPPGGARDIYSYYVKGTSTKTKTNIVPQAPFSDRWLKENAGAASGFFSRADEAGKLIWESDPNKNWWANRMDDVRGIVQGAVNPFLMGFQGLGVGAITDSAVNPVTYAAARKTLQGIHNLGNLSPEAQLAAATALQDSAFAVKDGINSAKQWADAHPNITATAQTALSVAEAAGTVWGGKKVELNPTKWDWVKNTDYKTPAARPMQTLDGEMAGGNKPVVKSIRPTTRDELRQALQEQGFRRTGSDAAQYETWKGPDGVKIDIRPNGEVIRTQRVPRTDGVQGKYPQRQDYEGNPLPNNHHHSGYFVK